MEPDYQGQPITTPDAPPFVPGVTDQRYAPEREELIEPITVPDDPPYVEGVTDKRYAPKVEEVSEFVEKASAPAGISTPDLYYLGADDIANSGLSQIESEKLVAQNNWVKESLGNIDSALLDYENFSPQSSESVKNQALIRATMEVELGYDPPTISEYEIGRGQAYKQLFGKDLPEDLGDPEQAFVSALTNRATEKRDQVAFNETIRNEALLSALTGWSKYDASWGEAAKADPVYQKDPAAAANKFKSFKQAFEDEFNDVIPIVRNLDKFIRNNDMDSSLRLIEDLDEEEFSKTAKLLGFIEKQTLATKGEEGLLSNLAKSTGRDFESFSRKFKEGFFDLLSGISAGSTGADFVAEDVLYRDKVNGFLAEIRRFRDQRDPIKLLAEEDTFLSSAEKALYATPGVGFSIAGSVLTGPAGTMGLLMESNQEDYYLRAIDAGVSREESNKLATTVGSPIALLQFIPERIGLGAVTRKLPVLDNVVNKITQKHFRVTLQALARSGAETTTEEIQAILSEVGNDVLNGLKNDIPEADWDAHWDNFGSRNLETFLSISPYASLGAFVRDRGVDKSIAMANEASADELVASGYEKEKVQNFQESEDIGKRKAFFEMLESQDPTRPETKEAVDNLAKLNEMAKKTQAEYSQLRISPGVRMDPKKKGYEVYNTESGDIIATLETAQQATETVFEIFGVKESQRQAAFDELLSKFEAGRLDVDESGEMVEIETRTFTQADALVELPGSDARIETEAKLIEQRNGGTGEVTEEVMSGGQTIFGVYIPAGQMGRKEAATKIFNGSSILTLIHERGHGKRRILMANGKWSRSQQIGSLKALDGMLDEGDRFLPATFEAMSESDQEVALDEAVAELAEVLALRTRNGKKSKMRQLLSKNLSAMVRSRRPGAVQLKAFVDAIKEFFGLALRRAAVMKKAEREGKLSSAQLDALSDMLVGKTSQESFESERDAVPIQMVDGKMVDVPFSVSQSKTGMKPPKGVTSKTTEALPVWNISKQEDSLPKVIGNKKSRETFFARLDSALEWLRKDPAKIGTAGGWVTFLRKAGVYGDVPMPPTGITELFKDPAGYAAKVRGAYHGDLTIEGTNASAKQGLDGTSEMRDLIGKGNAPAPWAVALHHMWGILSRMLPPIDQEGMWLRLIAHRPVLDAIQSSIDGKFNLSLKQWQDLVQDARAASADAAGKIGNNATANANSFYLMLERLSGRWQDVANVYAAKDSREMGRRFWSLDAGALGIKNKVQRFIGLTFGVPGVIMDRWKFVELWLPTAVKGTDSESSKEYFKYSNSKPESPLPIYGVYGDLDAKNIVVSTALYEGLEVAMQEAINRSPELQDLLGDHQNPGGLHWYGWNAIKNEAVGHSSLDLTKDLIKNYGLDFGVDAVVKQINEGEYFTEGTIGSSENAKVFLRNGKIDVSRTRISSGFQSGRGSRVLGRGVSEGDGESRQGVSFSLGRSEVTPTADTQTFPTKDGGVVGPASFSISAFHGTPHKVDKFSTEQIGTGEGAQAYGWGLYFAQDKDVAQQYRIALAYDPDKQRINGRQINDEYSRYNTATATSVDYQILEGLERLMMHDSPAEVIEMFEEEGYSQKAISYFKDSKYETFGGLYTVELNVEQDELIDWDKPLSEQPKVVQENLREMVEDYSKDFPRTADEINGGEIYFEFVDRMNLQEGQEGVASKSLYNIGIKGIRYLDGNSRADGEGTSNYVIFNDADITITEENGKPVSPSFQIGDTKMLSDLAENAKRRAKRPETRAMVFKDIAERLNKLRRDVPRIIKSFGKEFEQAEIIDPRTMKSLRKEAAFRQALKQEELEQEILQKEGQALQSGDVPVLKDMPVHGFIANVGKGLAGGSMESRSAYRKRTGRKPGAEYEGSEGMVGGLLYGGGRSPDQVAQELFEQNLIPDDSPAAMWEALASERESVASQKADFKAAMAKLRGVKSEAKAFADEWLKGEVEKQKRDYNPTERTKRALVMYDAILKALPPKLRGSMGGFVQIGNLKTDEARLKFLEKKLDKADDVVERFIKREMTKEAKKLIKSGLATIKTGEVDRGTKGATVHRLFEVIKDVFSGATTAEAVIAGMEKERQIREDSGQLTAEWDGYYNTAPSIVEGFAEWKEQTAEEMTVAVENAAAFYERGWLQSKIKAALRSEMIEAAIQNLRDGKSDEEIDEAITKSEEAIGSMWDNTKSIGREFIDFEQFLISTFGRIDVVNQLVDREYESYRDREQMRVEREYDESQFYADFFNGDVVKGYRYKYDLKTERVKLDSLGSKGAPKSMTKSQIIHWLMMYRQADGRRHFDGDGKRWEFTPEFFVQLEEKLDDRDMRVMEWYSEQYAGEWEMVNPIYEEIRGSTLVKNEEYSPVTVAPKMISIGGLAGAVMDPLSGEQVGAMEATPSMFKRRSKSAIAKPRVEGAIEIFQAHKTQVEHWIATAELTRDMKALFGRREAREIVEAKSGTSGLRQLQSWIEDLAKQGIKDTSVGMSFWSSLDRMISRVSRMALFGKLSTIVIQASQVAGAAAQIPARAYMSKLAKAATGQLDLSVAWRSPYIQGRLADTLPMVRLAYSNARTKKPTKLSFYSDKIGQAIGFSDAIFTTATYAAIFDHVKNEIRQDQGLTGTALEKAAHKEAGKRTERVAQPVRKARRSLIENYAQGNVALRAFFAFASEPRQKLGSAFWEMFNAVRKRDRVKNAMVYGVGFAVLGSVIRAAIADLRDEGEDDEFFDEENWNVDKLVLKSMTDNFNGVPIVGPKAESGFISLAKKLGMDTPPVFPNEGLLDDPTKAIPAAQRLITLESMENSHDFSKDVRKTLQAAGMIREEAATAAVFWNMVEEVIRTMPVVE